MSIDRRFLYPGLFLAALGGVLVAVDLTAVDRSGILDALRLWPLALVTIGAAIVLRRTRAGLTAGVLAALVPGLLLGGTFAAAPRFVPGCSAGDGSGDTATESGILTTAATVLVETGCGDLAIGTAPGNRWELNAANTSGWLPNVDASSDSLIIEAGVGGRQRFVGGGRDTWELTLPTSTLRLLAVTANANGSTVDLRGADIGTFALTVNASAATVDASGATVGELNSVVNFGALSIVLPAASDLTGSFTVSAGALSLCAPPGLGLRITHDGVGGVDVAGEHMSGSIWESPDYGTAAHRADLQIEANFAGVDINPIGGCS